MYPPESGAGFTPEEVATLCVVGISSALWGCILQLTAYENVDRDKRSAAGAFGGLLLGSLSSLTQSDDLLLPFVGFGGGGLGALIGWVTALRICRGALNSSKKRAALLFLHEGAAGVRAYVSDRDAERRTYSLSKWSSKYGDMVRESKDVVLRMDPPNNQVIEAILRVWIRSLADMFNYLMVEADAPQTDRWNLRASFIRFEAEGEPIGRHWVSYAGAARPHSANTFDATSVAYQVVSEKVGSPVIRLPNDKGVADRESEPYWAFAVFCVNHWVVLSIDWQEHTQTGQNLEILLATVGSHLVPAANDLLSRHSQAREVLS